MRPWLVFVLAGLFLQALAMPAQAISEGSATQSASHLHYYTCFPAVVTFITAGCADWWIDSPTRLSPGLTGANSGLTPTNLNGYQFSATVASTVNPLGVVSITGAGTTTYGGCHVGTVGATVPTLFSAVNYLFVGVDPGATYCGGAIQWQYRITVAAITQTIATVVSPIEMYLPTVDNMNRLCSASPFTNLDLIPGSGSAMYPVAQPCTTAQVLNFECGASGLTAATQTNTTTCLIPQVDNENRLCAASTFGAACNTPTINAAITGSLTATLSGTLDVLNRLCAASATGSSCTTATLNAIVSGTLDNLNRLCDDSALGSACNEVHFTADMLNRLCNASALNATCTTPNVNAALTSAVALTVHQDPICTASSHCFQDISGLTINQTMGNVSVVVPSETTTHLCGPVTNTSACSPVASAATISSVEAAHWLPILAILAVLLAGIFWANPLLITLGIIGFPVYFATMSPVKELGWLAMIMLSILAPAIARFYANYKARMERGAPI